MATIAQTTYAFITNDLHSQTAESIVVPLSPAICKLQYCASPECCKSPRVLHTCNVQPTKSPALCERDNPVISPRQIVRGPSERKIRCSSSVNRIQNSWSSDAIKQMLPRADCVNSSLGDSLPSKESSATSSPSEQTSPASDWNVPLLKNTKSKSFHIMTAAKQSSRSQTFQSRRASRSFSNTESVTKDGGLNTFTDRARQVWTALERKFTSTNKISQSRSASNLADPANSVNDNVSPTLTTTKVSTQMQGKGRIPCLVKRDELTQCPRNVSLVPELSTYFWPSVNTSLARNQKNKSTYSHTNCSNACGCRSLHLANTNSESTNHLRITTSQSHGISLSRYACDRHSSPSDRPSQAQFPTGMDSSNTDLREMREVTLTRTEPGQKFGIRIDNFGHGVYLTTVLRGSPAASAGLKVGDELVRLNGLPVSHLSATTVMILIRSSPSCLRITFKPRVLLARVREVSVQKSDGRIGIRIKQRSESLFVDVVLPKSPASFAGMKEGDELLMINNRNMRDWDQDTASQYLRDLPDGENVLFRVRDVLPSVCRHLLTGPAPKNTQLYKIKSSRLNTHSLANSEVDVSGVDLFDQSSTKSSCCHCNLVQSKRYPQSRQGHQADCEQITKHGAPKLIIKGANESNVAFLSDASTQGGTRLVNSISDWAIGQHQHAKCQ